MRLPFGSPPWAGSIVRQLGPPDQWYGRLKELVETAGRLSSAPRPAPPPRVPTGGGPLGLPLDEAKVADQDTIESAARGAIRTGAPPDDLLDFALRRIDRPLESGAAEAVMSAATRDLGYDHLIDWAAADPGEDPVTALAVPPPLHEDLFTVPRRVFAVGKGLQRRFQRDYPWLRGVVDPARPLGEPVLFRPETVPALAHEQELTAFMGRVDDDQYEDAILPMSRIPGVNVIVLAALLLHEVLDPMEVLGWIGADVNALPRPGTPNRPEDLHRLPAPTKPLDLGAEGAPPAVKYMIFSDIHREPPQDVAFRVSHFSDNQELYLRALDWCDENGYTVVENGDCEELWYVPTFKPGDRQPLLDRLKDIVELHQPVYAKLSALTRGNRYFRSIGNHDSYLWERNDIREWRRNNPGFPHIYGGFLIAGCKPMDDFWPPVHLGLDPDDYHDLTDMVILHGHQFDFWNCDEHNRLGKFITNAVAIPTDALDNVIYDFRGIDRMGHPVVEFWDLLAPITPWNNWPPEDVAREWAEALEYRPLGANITQDGITFSETFASVIGILLRTGPVSLSSFRPILCIGHTHNPQSRPWIPYLERFNPFRTQRILGQQVFENAFWIKTRYLNSGTVGWWQHVIWAIEVTEEGQPRLVYWSDEDDEPIGMDWELDELEDSQKPPHDLAGFLAWARQYLQEDVAAGFQAALDALAEEDQTPPGDPGAFWGGGQPDVLNVFDAMGSSAGNVGAIGRGLPLSTAAALAAVGAGNGASDRLSLAALTLASRQSPLLRGADPRDWVMRILESGREPPELPASAALQRLLLPQLMTGAPRADNEPEVGLGVGSLLRGLRWSFKPGVPRWLDGGAAIQR